MLAWQEDRDQGTQFIGSSHRIATLEETIARVLPMARDLGITRLANITFLDRIGIPVYQCIRPNSRTLSVSQGKGVTFLEAKIGALMESVESWHAEQPRADEWHGSLRDLRNAGKKAVDVDRLPKAKQQAFDEERQIAWWKGADLSTGAEVWVPREVASLDRTRSRENRSGILQRTSLGLASGNSASEATLHALFEIIERDAYASWLGRTGGDLSTADWLELATLPEPARSLAEMATRAGVLVGISELPSRVEIPCYQCIFVSCDTDAFGPAYAWGMGCHAARGVALVRCITEAAQTRLTLISGARDDLEHDHYAHFANRSAAINLAQQLNAARRTGFVERPGPVGSRMRDLLTSLSNRLADAGCGQVVGVNLTDERLRLPVVKLVVPGMKSPADGDEAHYS